MPHHHHHQRKSQFTASVKNQFLAIGCANIVTLSHGCILGWLSPFLPLLKSADSPLESGAVTVEQASWIGAIICAGGLLGNAVFGVLVNRLGCKRSIAWLALPQLLFWLTVLFGTNVWHLYVARICAGMTGGGLFICIPLFVAEIADDHIRGTLGSLLLVNCNIGILASFCIGAYVPYRIVPYVLITLPLLFFGTFAFLPETPQHLLRSGQPRKAEAALRFYRNAGATEDKESAARFADDFARLQASLATRSDSSDAEPFHVSELFAPTARRGLLIGITLCVLNQFSGCFALINYSATIFHDSGATIDPHRASIVLASVQIAGTYISSCLVDRLGRKVLLIGSTVGTAVGLSAMGAYTFAITHLDWQSGAEQYGWVPVASLSFVVLVASVGILPLPFVVLAEVLPSRVRAVGSSLCVTSISLVSFVILKSFPLVAEALGLHGCMWIFAGVCVAGAIFIGVVVEETRGKQLNGGGTVAGKADADADVVAARVRTGSLC